MSTRCTKDAPYGSIGWLCVELQKRKPYLYLHKSRFERFCRRREVSPSAIILSPFWAWLLLPMSLLAVAAWLNEQLQPLLEKLLGDLFKRIDEVFWP